MASSISNVCVCFSYDFGEEHGLPWTQNSWQGLKTDKSRSSESAALLPVGLTLMAATATSFLKISHMPQHRSHVMKTQPRSQNSSPTQPHADPSSTRTHILHSRPRESPHTLKHLKTGAETREDGEISMHSFSLCSFSLLHLLDIPGCL